MAIAANNGRTNQKTRTRRAIVDACVERIRQRQPVTMPEVAKAAMVSEATAYRYFPDLASLLAEALARGLADSDRGPRSGGGVERSGRTSGLRLPLPPPRRR